MGPEKSIRKPLVVVLPTSTPDRNKTNFNAVHTINEGLLAFVLIFGLVGSNADVLTIPVLVHSKHLSREAGN